MVGDPGNGKPSAEGWGEYWCRTHEAAAHRSGGPQEEVLARFWAHFLDDALAPPETRRVLDLGCGNGALARLAAQAASRAPGQVSSVFGVDSAVPALRDLHRRCASVQLVAADARRLPFPDACFDVVCSQFGIEYAGVSGFSEAARLVAAGGTIGAIIHMKDGALYRESGVNLDAINTVRQCGILTSTREVFRAAAALARRAGSRGAFRRADESLAAAVRQVDGVLQSRGEAVAGGAIYRLYADVAHMYGRMGAYDAEAVARWAEDMTLELAAYAGRMSSMRAAAIDASGMEAIVGGFVSRGLSVRIREEMHMGSVKRESAAWALVCDRRQSRPPD